MQNAVGLVPPLLIAVAVYLLVRRRGGSASVAVRSEASASEVSRPAEDPLAAATRRWVAAGLIDEGQAAAIVELEAETSAPALETRLLAEERLPLAAEAVGYLGGALVVIAGIVALGQAWEDLPVAAHVATGVAAAIVLAVAGAVVRRRPEPAFVRLTSVLWLLTVGAAAFTAGVIAHDLVDAGPPGIVMASGLTALVAAGLAWWLHRQPLQHLAVFSALVASGIGVVLLAGQPDTTIPYGLVVWGVGAAWMALSWRGLLEPPLVGWALGGFAALFGAQLVAGDDTSSAPGLVLGIATVVVLFVLGIVLRQPSVLALGVVGVFWFVPQTVVYFVGDALGVSVTLALVGLVLLGVAAGLYPLRDRFVRRA